MRQQRIRHVGVVLKQVTLGQPEGGPEHFAQIGEPDFLAVDDQRDVVGVTRDLER